VKPTPAAQVTAGNDTREDVRHMSIDDAKGKVKEAAGDVTGDDQLKAEGKIDQAAGKLKDAADAAKDKVEGLLHKH
jgi:uncharacterized protein YjbJ (UPF0337 family)